MTVKGINKLKIVKKRMLKVRRFQSDRVQKVKVHSEPITRKIAELEEA
ncbi:MAG: hypothetical protein P4L10_07025 [Acidobacteriaceae bacterium]|nr:hypothetical protein [Acidobacteriaceae bacterium]